MPADPGRVARRRRRFAAWALLVVALFPGQCAWLIVAGHRQRFPWIEVVVGQLLIGLMGALLSTTPSDAVRLRRGSSEGLILAGAAALLACGGTGLGYAVAGVAGCGFLLWVLRRTGASPWWAALVAWNPLLPAVGALAVRSAG